MVKKRFLATDSQPDTLIELFTPFQGNVCPFRPQRTLLALKASQGISKERKNPHLFLTYNST